MVIPELRPLVGFVQCTLSSSRTLFSHGPREGVELIFFHTYEGKILGQVEPGRGKALCGQLSGVD